MAFDKLYGSGSNKYVVLSETAASYTVNLNTNKPNSGGASEEKIKQTWFSDLIGASIQEKVPNFRAFVWFEIISPFLYFTRYS